MQPAQTALNYLVIAPAFAVVRWRQTKIDVNQLVEAGRQSGLSCADYNKLRIEDMPAPQEIVQPIDKTPQTYCGTVFAKRKVMAQAVAFQDLYRRK